MYLAIYNFFIGRLPSKTSRHVTQLYLNQINTRLRAGIPTTGRTKGFHPMTRKWVHFTLFALLLAFLTAASSNLKAQDTPIIFGPQSPAACSVPTTATIRGKSVDFDQCYERTFSHSSTTYTIHVFYTEQDTTNNLNQCTDDENDANRCEHKMSNNDDSNGDNVNAVEMADEAELALDFYFDRNIDVLTGTTLNVYIAEDPRSGGIISPNSIYVDDERIDNTDDLWKRILAFHEIMHLVQDKYDNGGVGWRSFYGEGISRAIEDRVDTTLDADTGHYFIPEVNGILGNNSARADDIVNISYRSVLWWTWMMDQYRSPGDSEPDIGWSALRDFYIELNSETDQVDAINDFINAAGGSFRQDFIDYTLSLYAHEFNPSDDRLTYLDSEILANTNGLSNHTVLTGGPNFGPGNVTMNPRSSHYIEFDPANQCDFIAFSFDGNGKSYGFSVMTVDGGTLDDRWTSYSDSWARTVRSSNLDSVVGVVTAFDNSGAVDIDRGCVKPTLNIKNPTSAQFEMIGPADNARNFIVRLDVDGADGSGVAGLVASDFTVEMEKAGGGPTLTATVINAVYVQDDYWLLVSPPSDTDGAESGQFYDLTVSLGTESDSENSSLLYVKRTQDVVIVLDRSGSMSFASGKIVAARNAATLLINELADDDQGAYVAYDTNADLREPLAPVGSGGGSHRDDIETAIGAEVPLNLTSIGDGMNTAATEHDNNGIAANMCSFVLLSDGYENEPAFWADVQANVVDNGCAIHAIAMGPGANETLMQQISSAVPGGSYDYADVSGSVPINGSGTMSTQAVAASLSWEINLSRIYDAKATQIAGRQRLQTAQNRGSDNEPFQEYKIYVDKTADELVVSVAWEFKTKGEQKFELIDPSGSSVTPDYQRFSESKTNEVLKVKGPDEGYWTLRVYQLYQEYFVSASSMTDIEMYLFIGTPVDELSRGVKVPLLVTFVGPEKPIVGADVQAQVRAPNGQITPVTLYDDGNHGDAEPSDGIYGGTYTATSQSDAEVPKQVTENEEPAVVGSYLVTVVGVQGDLRREAQGSFAIEPGADVNENRLPDAWEKENGVSDPGRDDDGDKLSNYCEFTLGTHPLNPDTDGGGESDGSEAPNCKPIRNPLDASDDRVGRILSILVFADLLNTKPVLILNWGQPQTGRLVYVNIYRRATAGDRAPAAEWELIATEVAGNSYVDGGVVPGSGYEYQIEPVIEPPGGGAATGSMLTSTSATPSEDPYAPGGSIMINNGALTTAEVTVNLSIAADDLYGDEDGAPENGPLPGTPTKDLEMRMSNTADFAGAQWQPFQSEVPSWNLGSVGIGDTAVVYIQFRDEAGNVSESGMSLTDTIVFLPNPLFLPAVMAQ